MKRFAALYAELEQGGTLAKLAALKRYLAAAPPQDAVWALWFLGGRKLSRVVAAPRLRQWTAESLQLAPAIVEDCYAHVGDLAETLALLWDLAATSEAEDLGLAAWVARLEALRGEDEAVQRARLEAWWRALPTPERFLLNKLLTGALRVGVAAGLVARALAEHAGIPPALAAQRLMGDWPPGLASWARLTGPEDTAGEPGAPLPFCLASPLDVGEAGLDAQLGPVQDWLIEWKWDGIRAQLIRRGGQHWIWSRGEEPMEGRFPEIDMLAQHLPDGTVLDGEVLAWKDGRAAPFALLQQRIGRKRVGAKLLAEAPVQLLAYDLLEHRGEDWRSRPLAERRAQLEVLGREHGFAVSPRVDAADWTAYAALREQSRERGVEGFMLKRLDSPYGVGRKRGLWWKWKIGALTVDGVLVYAQAGHGRRANLYTDYTLAVWDQGQLVPFAKAYSGLSDAELTDMDRWIRKHTRERFGPVRSVEPLQVFEIAFEGIQASPRHKSGIALRFPRIQRWRHDKPAHEADTLDTLRALLAAHGKAAT